MSLKNSFFFKTIKSRAKFYSIFKATIKNNFILPLSNNYEKSVTKFKILNVGVNLNFHVILLTWIS